VFCPAPAIHITLVQNAIAGIIILGANFPEFGRLNISMIRTDANKHQDDLIDLYHSTDDVLRVLMQTLIWR
jgi:hypothetical protein